MIGTDDHYLVQAASVHPLSIPLKETWSAFMDTEQGASQTLPNSFFFFLPSLWRYDALPGLKFHRTGTKDPQTWTNASSTIFNDTMFTALSSLPVECWPLTGEMYCSLTRTYWLVIPRVQIVRWIHLIFQVDLIYIVCSGEWNETPHLNVRRLGWKATKDLMLHVCILGRWEWTSETDEIEELRQDMCTTHMS